MPRDRLARSFDEMIEAKNLMFPPITFEKGKAFRVRPSDVIITPWSKSGTTWLQQIAHGLRSRGDMDFADISEVSPWIEVADALEIDLDADQGWEPRLFKSHYSYTVVPKGCRYIVSFRNPHAALRSYYSFYEGWLFEPGTVSLDEYLAPHLQRSGKDYWSHLASWWAQRDNPDLLLLSFELMQEDLRSHVAKVADFLGFGGDDELIALVTRQSTLDFMLEHEDRFNDKMHRERGAAVGSHPPGIGSTKVTPGVDPERYVFSDDALAKMAQRWAEEIAEPFGFAEYDDVTAALRVRG